MTQIQRKVIDRHKNVRQYFSRTELSQRMEMVPREFRRRAKNSVTSALLEVPGVTCIGLTAYCVEVYLAETYEWSEVEPSILKLLTSFNLGEGKAGE